MLVLTGSIAGCMRDPYARYAAAVHQDVDAAMAAGFRMTARMQLSVVHNVIPLDSMAVVASVVTRAAQDVRERATHFSRVDAPPELARAHADLGIELSRLAAGLDSVAAAFHACAQTRAAGDSTGDTCRARLAALPSSYAFIGEDLTMARSRVQRLLQSHGILLGPMTAR